MFFPLLLIFFFISKAQSGELLIAKSPPSVRFEGNESIDQHLVPEILSTALGFTAQQDLDWNGVTILSPFAFAKALVVFFIDGVSSLENFENLKKYTLINDESEFDTWKTLRDKIINRYPMINASITELNLKFTDEDFTNKHNKFLKSSVPKENDYLNEMNDLNSIISKVRKSESNCDFEWFSIKSSDLLPYHKDIQDNSITRAKIKIYKSFLAFSESYSSAYNDQVLVVALTSNASHTRKVRSVINNKDTFDSFRFKDNIYNPDFPVIFNIILWFTVALIFALIAVSVFIASMDPGRDSIIYRMTSNRMKKDS